MTELTIIKERLRNNLSGSYTKNTLHLGFDQLVNNCNFADASIISPNIDFGEIVNGNKTYNLISPLYSNIKRVHGEDGDYFEIDCPLIDIVAVGNSPKKAKEDFDVEFSYLYERLKSLNNEQLSSRLQKIKDFLNFIVR